MYRSQVKHRLVDVVMAKIKWMGIPIIHSRRAQDGPVYLLKQRLSKPNKSKWLVMVLIEDMTEHSHSAFLSLLHTYHSLKMQSCDLSTELVPSLMQLYIHPGKNHHDNTLCGLQSSSSLVHRPLPDFWISHKSWDLLADETSQSPLPTIYTQTLIFAWFYDTPEMRMPPIIRRLIFVLFTWKV